MKPLLVLLFCFNVLLAAAQQHITGTVTGSNTPLQGVSVHQKDGKASTLTDAEGKYSIDVPSGATLAFSYVGYQDKEVVVGTQTTIDVQLESTASDLSEVVVVGYGTQKKKDLTGAIATVSSKAFQDQPVLNASTALQGRATGVAVNSTSGSPGSTPKIRIRGANSINTTNDPLYVVDGIALASNDLNSINPDDIATMDILKDASATAIYGSRGANGVVIITTKKGAKGAAKITYDGFLSMNKPIKKYDLMDVKTFGNIANLISPGLFNTDTLTTSTDMQSLIFDDAVIQNHNLSITGGSENIHYYISGQYQDQPGVIINNDMKTYGLRANIGGNLTKKLSFNLNMGIKRVNRHNPDAALSYNAFLWPLTEPIYTDADQTQYNRKGSRIITVASQEYMTLKEANVDNFANQAVITGNATYKFTDWLSFTTNIGLDALTSKTATLKNDWISQGNPSSSQSYSENYAIQNSNVLTFHKAYGLHDLTATAVMESSSSKGSGFTATGAGLSSMVDGYNNLALNSTQSITSTYSNWSQLSYVGRVIYNYDNRYMVTGTFRRDGSSKFQNNKWGSFPSIGLGWNVLNESFAKNWKAFSHLKLRGGWGITGNDRISPYTTLGLLSQDQYAYGSSAAYIAYYVGNPATPNLKWETTKQADAGLDVGFFNDRLSITADYYNKNTTDLLLATTIANYNGGGSLYQNVGKVNNKGFELGINATPVTTDNFNWSTYLNLSYNKNMVVDLGEDSLLLLGSTGGILGAQVQALQVGKPMGSFYLTKWAGIYQQADAALGYSAGDNRFVDANGNNVSGGLDDRMVMGSATPKYQLGFGNDITYKDFTLNIYIQGSYGNDIYNENYAIISSSTSASSYPTLKTAANYWTSTNTGAEFPTVGSKTNNNGLYSSHFLQDGSYTRLKNLGLTYRLPKIKNISAASLTLSAQNLFTITKYKGLDPEVAAGSGGDTQAGIDLNTYPSAKTYTLRLNITF
ncbi:TonB-linked outer membrane protein, SusC/RagA family [Arachidicoccus rhizosphaerae]|uniref:TonB-linked outer membrane protein, SusC/RagA family n=1 Tax=Arachidicoccus rhizosphaerae TaxID=551991 RepID=A0A1H3XZ13_9BACT|nr:TonB-dependent receptor [Arachidicoccus rhizosphaerae]SEA04695.1 TonB-linked outer membrane protein, SusC/RagA family [Arachidicoccus rhizosphaerae]